jgi:hypothetical protein
MSEPVTVTDYDECRVTEGTELGLRGTRFTPYPAVPGPRPRPAKTEEGSGQ